MKCLLQIYYEWKEKEPTLFYKMVRTKKYAKNELIIQQGCRKKHVYLILNGIVRSYFLDNGGNEIDVFLSEKGYIVGAPDNLLQGCASKYYCEALADTEVAYWVLDELENAARIHPIVFDLYNHILKNQIELFVNRLEAFVCESPESRYVNLYKRRPKLVKEVPQKHFSKFLGISPNSLSRIKKRIIKNVKNLNGKRKD